VSRPNRTFILVLKTCFASIIIIFETNRWIVRFSAAPPWKKQLSKEHSHIDRAVYNTKQSTATRENTRPPIVSRSTFNYNNSSDSGSTAMTTMLGKLLSTTITGATGARRRTYNRNRLLRPRATGSGGTMGCCAARGTTMMLCLIAVLGLYLATMTIMFTERIRTLEHNVEVTNGKLKMKERELYIKKLQLADKKEELNEKTNAMYGVSDKLHQDANTLAEQAALKKQLYQSKLNARSSRLASATMAVHLPEGHTKPKFVFNIGPMKTGSTTLQNYGVSDRIVLRQNGYVWPAEMYSMIYASITPSTKCMLQSQSQSQLDSEEYDESANEIDHNKECPSFNQDRIDKLAIFLKRNEHMHTYLCDEMFGVMPDNQHVWKSLEFMKETHEVELVVTYRRYFEWWVSFYIQAFKYGNEEELITSQWPDVKLIDTSPNDRYTNHVIPHQRYFDLMQFDETSIFMRRWGIKHGQKHPTQAQKDRFEPHFAGVKVFNYHLDKDNLVASFYCHMMPEATKACAARTRVGTKAHLNSAVNLNYDILAVAAYEQGLIQTEIPGNTRNQMAGAAQHRQEKMLHKSGTMDFPMVCMSEVQLQQLLEMSLKFEQDVVPDWANEPGREDEHRAAFRSYVDEKKFCNIDANEVLKDEEWQSFFKYLRLKPESKEPTEPQRVAGVTDRQLVRVQGTNRFRTATKPKANIIDGKTDSEGMPPQSIGRWPAANLKNRLSMH
jgi:hypothetical protein